MQIALERGRGEAPLYAQLAKAIERAIETESLRPGDLLPGEHSLAQEHGLSRATVVRAFNSLSERGLVTRQQGRGTYVQQPPMERPLSELTGFSEHVRGLGRIPGQRLLEFAHTKAEPQDGLTSHYDSGTDLVVAHRLRTVDDRPAGLQRTALPGDLARRAGITRASFDSPRFSLYARMSAAGVVLERAQESLCAINASATDAAALQVDEGDALIEVTRLSRDAAGRLVEAVRARYLGSLYVYRVELAHPTVIRTREKT